MFFTFVWWRVEVGLDEIFASLVRTANGVRFEKRRKTSIAQQVTALPIFESQLNILAQIQRSNEERKGKEEERKGRGGKGERARRKGKEKGETEREIGSDASAETEKTQTHQPQW